MQNTKTIPMYRPATQAEEMTWDAVVSRAKVSDGSSTELECLRRIERRAEQRRVAVPYVEGDKLMAAADVADFEAIDDPHLQRFAAVQISDNLLEYPDYKTSLVALDANKPGLNTKLAQLNAVNDQLIVAKEDRKAAEYNRCVETLDASDVAKLTNIAEEKTVLARVWDASLVSPDGQEHFGVVLEVGSRFALQKTGRETFPLHRLSVLDQLPVKGQNVSIKYDQGRGVVVDQDVKRDRDAERGAGR